MGWGSAVQKKEVVKLAPRAKPKKVEYREDIITLDFETYWDKDYTLRKLSTSEYIRDKRFKAHMCGVKVGTGPTIVLESKQINRRFGQIDWTKTDLLCHNTAFDGFIMKTHYNVVPRRYLDTLSMARGLHGNDIDKGLNSVAEFYGEGNKLEDILVRSCGVLDLHAITDASNYKRTSLYDQMAEYCTVDVDLCYAIFHRMLPFFPERELLLVDQFLRMFCDPILEVDRARVEKELEREIADKERKILAAVGSKTEQVKLIIMMGRTKALEYAKKEIAKPAVFADMLTACGVVPPMKSSPTNPAKKIFAFSKTDEEFLALQEHHNPQVRELVEARLSVKSTTNETRAGRFLSASANGAKLPVMIQYYGAHTGRPSGGNKMNMLNLKRGGELRKSILAPAGHEVIVADSGQIEARVVAWISGQEDSLNEFRAADAGTGRDPYSIFADSIYGYEINKEDHPTQRFIGKVGKLGLGYQMGPPRFQTTLAVGALGGDPVFMELPECQRIVYLYRKQHDKIVEFWEICSDIIRDMVRGHEGEWKCLRWEKERVWLPNGMCLKYPNVREKHSETGIDWVYDRKGSPSKIYGGLLTENIVQALANVIITDQMIEIGKRWRVVMMTYDELVCLAPTKQAPKCFKDLMHVMAVPPPWCPDLPLFAEGGHARHYSK